MNRTNLAKIREWASEQGQCVRRVRQLTVRQQTTKFSAGTLPMSAYGRNLPQNPLNSDVEEELIEREEEEVIEEYDSDYDSNLSSPRLSENEEMESDVVMPINLENAKWQTNKSSGQAAFVSLL